MNSLTTSRSWGNGAGLDVSLLLVRILVTGAVCGAGEGEEASTVCSPNFRVHSAMSSRHIISSAFIGVDGFCRWWCCFFFKMAEFGEGKVGTVSGWFCGFLVGAFRRKTQTIVVTFF